MPRIGTEIGINTAHLSQTDQSCQTFNITSSKTDSQAQTETMPTEETFVTETSETKPISMDLEQKYNIIKKKLKRSKEEKIGL